MEIRSADSANAGGYVPLQCKLDYRKLKKITILTFRQALDKGNLGNAKTDGMDKDLGFVGNQYNTMLSIFYVPYVIFAPPIGMLGKKYGPHRVLPIMMFCFGSATLLAASVKNWSGMMALRWFLGMAEVSFDHEQSVCLV